MRLLHGLVSSELDALPINVYSPFACTNRYQRPDAVCVIAITFIHSEDDGLRMHAPACLNGGLQLARG